MFDPTQPAFPFEQKAPLNALSDSTSTRRHGDVLEPQACAESEPRSPEWPTKQIEEAVQPSDQQRASLVALTSTTSHLSALLQSSCPSVTLVTPTGRLEAVASRLDSMIDAVTLERTVLNDFYASLNDGQKARFGAEIRQPPRARDRRAPHRFGRPGAAASGLRPQAGRRSRSAEGIPQTVEGYGAGQYFLCRCCYRLAYTCRSEDPGDRATSTMAQASGATASSFDVPIAQQPAR